MNNDFEERGARMLSPRTVSNIATNYCMYSTPRLAFYLQSTSANEDFTLCTCIDYVSSCVPGTWLMNRLTIHGRRSAVASLPQQTRAYGYFERAAKFQQDGDSLFNAAHCLAHGIGTDQDLERCVSASSLQAIHKISPTPALAEATRQQVSFLRKEEE